ncbi:MAG: hypothetical protein HY976_01360 [Candidatus Kerfeldbacteria bacterium]|nr:hypothetical protein [Candidatus Kerfeldbacteria bacterium]
MAELPSYKPRVKIGSLRQTTKKMMVTKTSGTKVGDTTLKKFLKEDKGLRRMAYGDSSSTVESWKGRHFMKDAKEKIEGSSEVRESFYGKKHTAEKAFRETVKEEIRQDQSALPKGPTKDELAKQKRMETARGHLRQYEQSKEIEKDQGDPLHRTGADPNAPAMGSNQGHAGSPAARSVKLAGGAPGSVGQAPDNSGPAVVAAGSGVGPTATRPTGGLPSVFGLRGRVLRVDPIKQTILVKVLNTPPELSIFIGRDRSVRIPKDARCWKDRHPIGCTDIIVGELVDVRGKVLNDDLLADEVQVNGGELPDFVVHLGRTEPTVDLPTATPDDLAIG